MLKEEYLEGFLIPLLKKLDNEKAIKKLITSGQITEFGKRIHSRETNEYLASAQKDTRQRLNTENIPENLQRIFLMLVIFSNYTVSEFCDRETEKKLYIKF